MGTKGGTGKGKRGPKPAAATIADDPNDHQEDKLENIVSMVTDLNEKTERRLSSIELSHDPSPDLPLLFDLSLSHRLRSIGLSLFSLSPSFTPNTKQKTKKEKIEKIERREGREGKD